jgi:CBS domain-containing protein
MARYERDYGREFRGGWRPQNRHPGGGMRPDGWGGNDDWRRFAGEEGWAGEQGEASSDFGYDVGFRGGRGDRGRRGYEDEMRARGGYGGRGWDSGYAGRDLGYTEGWEDRGGRGDWGGGRQSSDRSRARAADIMTQDPETVLPDATIAEVAQKMRDLDVGLIPVVDGTEKPRLRGVITDRDIAVRAVAEGKGGDTKVADCMTKDVRSVNKNDSMRDVMRVMRQDQIRRVAVTDREGRLVGIIAQADLAVDYAVDDQSRELEVGSTIERISEPAEPRRGGGERIAAAGRSEE